MRCKQHLFQTKLWVSGMINKQTCICDVSQVMYKEAAKWLIRDQLQLVEKVSQLSISSLQQIAFGGQADCTTTTTACSAGECALGSW